MANAEQLNDQRLQALIEHTRKRQQLSAMYESKRNESKSFNLKNVELRDEKKLQNYDKYQKIWCSNILEFERARSRLNDSALAKNSKVNAEQAKNGDITIQDRIERHVENQRNKDLIDLAITPSHDHNKGWYCSLRQSEHDNEFDGMRHLEPFNSRRRSALEPDASRSTINAGDTKTQLTTRDILSKVQAHTPSVFSKNGKSTFHKRRQTYDQKFISEDDRPLSLRRTTLTYYPCDSAKFAGSSPTAQGKFIHQKRLPQIQNQIVKKAIPFQIRNVMQLRSGRNASMGDSSRFGTSGYNAFHPHKT